ncbi:MAG: winged helix-turn-helix domain-containing protein [Cyclobacteriaceae bacterium]
MLQSSESYYIGDWLVEPTLQRVSARGKTKKVEPQLMDVLHQLALSPGHVVTKEQLMSTTWAGVVVTENVLTRAISSLRKTLEDDRSNPKYIETISKTGYRLIASVKRNNAKEAEETFTIKLRRKPALVAAGIILLIVLGAFATRSIFPSSVVKAYHPLALANYSNTEYWPAISPDGKFVAYSWKGEADNNWDIYARLIGTETILRITDNSSTDLRAQWSPDGNYIYYLRYENGGGTIYKKSVLGEKEIRVLEAPEHSLGNFDISPDERWISFNDANEQFSPFRIKLISLETNEEKWVTAPGKEFKGDIHPTFSPDGTQLAFIREKNAVSMQLWSFNLRNDQLEQLTTEHVSINGFDWSSDGSSLVYSSDQTGLYKMWEVNVETKESSILPIADYQMVMPRVAETGRVIYAKMEDNVNIWSYDLERKTAKRWRSTNDLNLNPSYSHDGEKVCFTTNKDGVFQVWVSNSNGSEAVPITSFTGEYLSTPRWSVDNQLIIFQGYKDGQADIFSVNSKGGVPENLTRSVIENQAPFVSQDNMVYYSENNDGKWGIKRMNLDGSNDTLITGENAYAAQLANDGSVLFYSKKGKRGLWVYDLSTEEEHLLVSDFHPMFWGSFAVADSGLYYLNIETKSFEYFHFDSKQSTIVYKPRARIPRLGITLSLSRDSKSLLFTQIDENDADIMMLEELTN